MKLNAQGMTSKQAWELCQWCGETAEMIRDYCQSSDAAARLWWENECDKPNRLVSSPRPFEYMFEFADRLQEESYEWAGKSGELDAEEDGFGVDSR